MSDTKTLFCGCSASGTHHDDCPVLRRFEELERENAAMREAIKEAHDALKRMNEEWQYQAQLGNVPDNRVETGMVSTALAKLQPHLT